MGVFILDVILRLMGIRGHIPGFDDFRRAPPETSSGTPLIRILAAFVGVFAVLSAAVWASVWLAIQLL